MTGIRYGAGKIIKEIGNYYIQETDRFYEAYSGYGYTVHWSRGLQNKQIKGFKKKSLNLAKAFLKRVASEGAEDKRYEELKKVDWSDTSNWKSTCSECGSVMEYMENSFVYVCTKCGNRLEV